MYIIADPARYKSKEELYIKVCDAEGRIVDDRLLSSLPYLPSGHAHAIEWQIRSDSLNRLIGYLKKKYNEIPLSILDVGCGNGWMAHRLSNTGHRVTGVDLNIAELEQAERVFQSNGDLTWIYADVMTDDIPGYPFDIILFSASCQYFSDIKKLTERMKEFLASKGEIHLLDSSFYKSSQIYEAKARSVDYYSRLGFPTMARYYFHHTIETLKSSGYKKLYPGLFEFRKTLQWWVCRND